MISRLQILLAVPLFASATLLAPQSAPVAHPPITQPGAPGEPSSTLPAATRPTPARRPSVADISFMQGMIMHHGQAVAMTALLRTRSHNPAVQSLGHKISVSQTDEMKYMRRWLEARGLATEMPMQMDHSHMTSTQMSNMDMSSMQMPAMPGMLTSAQMEALASASGNAFDRLFLTGMIQHHTGALTMVDQLFATPGAGQDADLFDFATDVDNTQRAEIAIMQSMLHKGNQ